MPSQSTYDRQHREITTLMAAHWKHVCSFLYFCSDWFPTKNNLVILHWPFTLDIINPAFWLAEWLNRLVTSQQKHMARSCDWPIYSFSSFRAWSLKRVDVFQLSRNLTMSQYRAISQLLSLGQESFEDEIRRLVSILIYNFSITLSLFLAKRK